MLGQCGARRPFSTTRISPQKRAYFCWSSCTGMCLNTNATSQPLSAHLWRNNCQINGNFRILKWSYVTIFQDIYFVGIGTLNHRPVRESIGPKKPLLGTTNPSVPDVTGPIGSPATFTGSLNMKYGIMQGYGQKQHEILHGDDWNPTIFSPWIYWWMEIPIMRQN